MATAGAKSVTIAVESGDQQVLDTLEFAKQLAMDYDTFNLLFVATPLPGTPLEVECRNKD